MQRRKPAILSPWTAVVRAVVVLCAVGALAPAVTRAQSVAQSARDEERAYELYDSAKAHFKAGRFKEAKADLEAARALDPDSPNLVFNLARATERMGEKAEALTYYREYEAMVEAGSPEQAEANEIIRRLERELLEPASVAPVAEPAPEPASEPEAEGGDGAWVPPVLLGTAGVLTVSGVVFGVLALGQKSAAEDATTKSAYDSAASKRTAFAVVSDVSFVGAAAAGAVGLVMLLTGDDEDEQHAGALRMTPWALADGTRVAAGVGGRW